MIKTASINKTIDDICVMKDIVNKDKINLNTRDDLYYPCKMCSGYNYNCSSYREKYIYKDLEEMD